MEAAVEYLHTLNEFVSKNQKDLPNKQTPIEWLVEQIETQNKSGYEFHPKYNQEILEKAKQLEKKSIEIITSTENQYLKNLEQKAFDMAGIIGRYQSLIEASIGAIKGEGDISAEYLEERYFEQRNEFNKVIGVNI